MFSRMLAAALAVVVVALLIGDYSAAQQSTQPCATTVVAPHPKCDPYDPSCEVSPGGTILLHGTPRR